MNYEKMSARELREIFQAKGYDPSWRLAKFFSIWISKALSKTRITPNQITILWGIFITLSYALLATGDVKYMLIVPLLIQIYLILDCVDGEVARMKGMTSVLGKKLDQLVHEVADNVQMLAITIAVYNQTKTPVALGIGVLMFFGRAVRLRIRYIIRTSIPPEDKKELVKRNQLVRRGGVRRVIAKLNYYRRHIPYGGVHLMILSALFGKMLIAFIIWTAVMNLKWTSSLILWGVKMWRSPELRGYNGSSKNR